jgi:hypothetical protein
MSLSIRAVSKAKFVDCSGYVDEEEGKCCDHHLIDSFPFGQEGLKTGCGVRREEMKKRLIATRGKVFTLRNLDRLIDCTGRQRFRTR